MEGTRLAVPCSGSEERKWCLAQTKIKFSPAGGERFLAGIWYFLLFLPPLQLIADHSADPVEVAAAFEELLHEYHSAQKKDK